MKKLPVSVIVPLSETRRDFFERFGLPLIEANNPEEIIIIDEKGSGPEKRNKGAAMAKSKYLFFCDDDNILSSNILSVFVDNLEKQTEASIAYSNFIVVNMVNAEKKNMVFVSRPWDAEALFKSNYIDTASLIKADDFIGFDEKVPRYQDWDMWLTMAKQGKKGEFVNDILFISFKIDMGITASVPHEVALSYIRNKHKL